MQKCSHTHLHHTFDLYEVKEEKKKKTQKKTTRKYTLYMLKLCRNSKLLQNIMNDSLRDLLWLVDIQLIQRLLLCELQIIWLKFLALYCLFFVINIVVFAAFFVVLYLVYIVQYTYICIKWYDPLNKCK